MSKRFLKVFFLPVTFGISLFFSFAIIHENASAYSVSVDVNVDIDCQERTNSYHCTSDLYSDQYLWMNNPNWCANAQLWARLSSEFRSDSGDYYLGYRTCWTDAMQDWTPHYGIYGFDVSKSDVKRWGYNYRRGRYEYWEYDICVAIIAWWSTGGEPGWDSDCSSSIVLSELAANVLTIKAIDTDGRSLSSIIPDVTVEVEYGETAYGCIGSATGYTKKYWGTGTWSGSWWSNTESCYNAGVINDDTTIYAVFERDEFSGRARVFEGNGLTGSNRSDTGFIEYDKTVSINMDCKNEGCYATFDLAMKRERGSGLAYYTGYATLDGTKYYITNSPRSPFSPSTSGTTLSIYNYSTYAYQDYANDLLRPGETYCYQVSFYPFGAYANNKVSTAEACAHANESTFQGKINVTGGATGDTGWKSESDSQNKILTSCTYARPCTVNFQHYLRRTSGIGSTTYTIRRTSNYSDVQNATLKSNVTEYFNNINNYTAVKEADDNNITLVPGQMVCELLTFNPTNNVIDVKPNAEIKYCAIATGNAQPSDPIDPATIGDDDLSNAFLDMRVKNNSGADKYKSYQKIVYAKPGDILTYRGTYNPILQYSAFIIPETMQIDGGSSSTNTFRYYLHNFFNTKTSPPWNNAISINSNENFSFSKNYVYSVGNTMKRKETNDYTVTTSKVGKKLVETARTNLNNTTKTTPSQVTFTASGSNINANVITLSKNSSAEARVPYNFDTEVEVIVPENKRILYSGEDDKFSYKIDVVKRTNPETTNGSDNDSYATIVPESVSKLIIYRPGSSGSEKTGISNYGSSKADDLCRYYGLVNNGDTCKYGNERTQTLNGNGSKEGSSNAFEMNYIVPDLTAGTKICVAIAVYPSNSGAYTNFDDPEGNHRWRISDSKCYVVAKRPSFQVWGGSLYSGGSITTSAAHKRTLRNLPEFTGTFVFSSWVEQSVVAQGRVVALASGAAAGLASNIAGGGSLEINVDYCKYRVPLSLANYVSSIAGAICTGAQVTGYSGISASITAKESIIARLPFEDSKVYEYNNNATIALDNGTPKNIVRYNVSKNATINSSTVSPGRTHIINVSGDVYINGDIIYQSLAFTSLEEIPKLIIYGQNVNIGCHVERIDAIIIAVNNLNTCVSNDINSKANSHKLLVNGAIMTDNLLLNRTYGAATGINSKIPAETVNYDVSTILWGRAKVDPNNKHRNLTAVYTHELAPRY
ncbi:hypothetical protein IJI89_03005 [Candidatus Saccharibacteria bacterium]|nr:hypothetical protein [Candidatus Saccharibacteria bacterium]